MPGALASGDGLDIADSPGTVADIRGLNAVRVGLATRTQVRPGREGACWRVHDGHQSGLSNGTGATQ